MKALWLTCLPFVIAVTVLAQGQIAFSNRYLAVGLDAPVFDVNCQSGLEGAAFLAQLYWGMEADSLAPVGETSTFRTGGGSGYFFLRIVMIPGVAEAPVFVQVRAWEASAGSSFEEAVGSGGKHGWSNTFSVTPVAPPGGPPAELVGLQSFCLIPEPPAGALGFLGAAAFWLAARTRPSRGSTVSSPN